MTDKAKVLSRRVLASGRFLELQELAWLDGNGVQRKWENAARKAQGGAALMICWLEPSDRLLLVRQYRPPAEGLVVEFPAGLIDAGEDAAAAALRELREETGYVGEIRHIWPAAYNTPGLSSERTHTVLMGIDEALPENQACKPDFQDGEDIEVLLVPRAELAAFVDRAIASGSQFDSKVVAYLAALAVQNGRH